MKTPESAWSNPYKTKLWLFSYNSNTFCKKELELWDHIAGFGARGCRDTNAQLTPQIDRSERQLQRYLRNLEKHHLIDIVPGWAELSQGEFRKSLRYRRIFALPWPNQQAWMRESIRESVRKWATKMSPYQRRTKKLSINQLRDDLLFGRPGSLPDSVSSPGASTQSFPQTPGGLTTRCSVGDSKLQELVRKTLIEQLIRTGWSREKAISLADVQIEKRLVQRKSDPKKY